MQADAAAIVRTVLKAAKAGDMTAARIVVDRLAPVSKDRPIKFELPAISNIDEAASALTDILRAVSRGEITPSEGQAVAGLIESFRKSVETLEHERRIRLLEEAQNAGKP